MNFWWASQGKNYPTVIVNGTLWSRPRKNGALYADRIALKDMRVGDMVFHYYRNGMRAVSVVREEWVDATTPEGYDVPADVPGWLVRVEPLATDLNIHRHRLAELVTWNSPGPLNKTGGPLQKYISQLSHEDGHKLLAEVGVRVPQSDDASFLGLPTGAFSEGDETDGQALIATRLEQGKLRARLIGQNKTATCDLCGHTFPARLLVAAHIKPRRDCSPEERANLDDAAMLACATGCDALFEWGYIVVDDDGNIRRGRHDDTNGVHEAVDSLVGLKCSAFRDSTRDRFTFRAALAAV